MYFSIIINYKLGDTSGEVAMASHHKTRPSEPEEMLPPAEIKLNL
jgi:hypothetical protein